MRITREVRLVARVLLRESEVPGKVEAAKFDQFVRTHHLEDRPVAKQMALMASHMVLHGLKATTISTYMKKAATYKRAKWAVDDLRRVKRLATTIDRWFCCSRETDGSLLSVPHGNSRMSCFCPLPLAEVALRPPASIHAIRLQEYP
jgi:hypothetical protein